MATKHKAMAPQPTVRIRTDHHDAAAKKSTDYLAAKVAKPLSKTQHKSVEGRVREQGGKHHHGSYRRASSVPRPRAERSRSKEGGLRCSGSSSGERERQISAGKPLSRTQHKSIRGLVREKAGKHHHGNYRCASSVTRPRDGRSRSKEGGLRRSRSGERRIDEPLRSPSKGKHGSRRSIVGSSRSKVRFENDSRSSRLSPARYTKLQNDHIKASKPQLSERGRGGCTQRRSSLSAQHSSRRVDYSSSSGRNKHEVVPWDNIEEPGSQILLHNEMKPKPNHDRQRRHSYSLISTQPPPKSGITKHTSPLTGKSSPVIFEDGIGRDHCHLQQVHFSNGTSHNEINPKAKHDRQRRQSLPSFVEAPRKSELMKHIHPPIRLTSSLRIESSRDRTKDDIEKDARHLQHALLFPNSKSRAPDSAQAEAKKMTKFMQRYSDTSKFSNSSLGGSGSGSGDSHAASGRIPTRLSMPSLPSYHTKDNDDLVICSVQDRPLTAELDSKMPPDDSITTSKRYRQMSDKTYAGVDSSGKIYTVYSAKETKEERCGPVYNAYCAKEVKDTCDSEGEAEYRGSGLVLPIPRSGSSGKASYLCPNRTSFDSLEGDSPGSGLYFDENFNANVIALRDEPQGCGLRFEGDDLNEPLGMNQMAKYPSFSRKDIELKHVDMKSAHTLKPHPSHTSKTSSTLSNASCEYYQDIVSNEVTSIASGGISTTHSLAAVSTTDATLVTGNK